MDVRGPTGQVIVTQGKDARNGGKPAGKNEGRKRLGDNLRRMYDEVVNEPVPQEMLELLSRLKDDQSKKSS
jgi:hypothetical protein